ncbi:MAG: NrfD/PsrC family molybdoenzyme membrane anchor subunit [Dehalococcoidales bacterium]
MASKTNQPSFALWSGSKIFLALAVALLVVAGWGIYAYSQELIYGLSVSGMGDIGTGGGAAWGLYIVFIVYFVGISFAGITIAALIRLFNLERLRPIARMAELLTIISLVMAAMVIIIDLGQPGRGIINLLRYARPMSPFFGTFTLVISSYLFASLVYFYLDGRKDAAECAKQPGRWQWFHKMWAAGYKDTPGEQRRHRHTTWWLALFILPILVIAHSTLGLVFGLQVGRPGWFNALQAPSFVLMAAVSGIGFIIIIAAILRSVPKLRDRLPMNIFTWLGNFTWILLIGYIYVMAVEILTSTYTAHRDEVLLTQQLFTGDYAWVFWSSLGLILTSFGLLFGQFLRRRYTISLLVVSGIMLNLAAIGKRFLLIVPSQTHGTLLPYDAGSYSPTWVEYSIILGVFAIGTLAYMLFVKIFPIMEIQETGKGE